MVNEDLDFDEAAYLKMYPDVARAVAAGRFASARYHFLEFGRAEGRTILPREPQVEGRTFCFGAYGTNNVGDEAIFAGVATEFPNAIQLYINKPAVQNSVWFIDVLEKPGIFRSSDHLVLGGGGLLYGHEPIDHMLQLATMARSCGAKVSLVGIGCEGFKNEYASKLGKLLELASTVSVRTLRSKEIIDNKFSIDASVAADFAYRLKPRVGRAYGSVTGPLRIGIVTGGDIRVDYSELAQLIQLFTLNTMPKNEKVSFVFVPHSRAYVDRFNNDVVVGQALWSSINIYHSGREELFSLRDFTADSIEALSTYRSLDGVVTARFHGMVFADIVGIPALCIAGDTLKNRSFIESYKGEGLFAIKRMDELSKTFDRFKDHVLAFRERRCQHIEALYPTM